jgi:hypothetical protein
MPAVTLAHSRPCRLASDAPVLEGPMMKGKSAAKCQFSVAGYMRAAKLCPGGREFDAVRRALRQDALALRLDAPVAESEKREHLTHRQSVVLLFLRFFATNLGSKWLSEARNIAHPNREKLRSEAEYCRQHHFQNRRWDGEAWWQWRSKLQQYARVDLDSGRRIVAKAFPALLPEHHTKILNYIRDGLIRDEARYRTICKRAS